MKTKLLRKVRKNYRIRENGLGERWVEVRHWLYGFDTIDSYYCAIINFTYNNPPENEFILILVREKYEKYSREYKIRSVKLKQVRTIK